MTTAEGNGTKGGRKRGEREGKGRGRGPLDHTGTGRAFRAEKGRGTAAGMWRSQGNKATSRVEPNQWSMDAEGTPEGPVDEFGQVSSTALRCAPLCSPPICSAALVQHRPRWVRSNQHQDRHTHCTQHGDGRTSHPSSTAPSQPPMAPNRNISPKKNDTKFLR